MLSIQGHFIDLKRCFGVLTNKLEIFLNFASFPIIQANFAPFKYCPLFYVSNCFSLFSVFLNIDVYFGAGGLFH